MKKIIMLLIMAGIFTGELSAQGSRGGAGFIKIGSTYLPGSASIFNEIAPPGISGFGNNFVAFGAEGYYRANKIILALDGNIAIQGVKLTESKAAEAFSGGGYARFGRIIKENRDFWVYPSIGVGTAAIALNTYDQVNAESSNEKINYLFNTSFDFGFNADFILLRAPGEKYYSALILGLRTGYRVSYKNDNWHGGDDYKISNTPSYGYHGYYIMATFGIGSFTKK